MRSAMGERPRPRDLLERVAAPQASATFLPRTVVVVAHPDDEVIALGARLRRFRDAVFVHVTDGCPLDGVDAIAHGYPSLEAYRAARQEELHNALQLAGIPPSRACGLRFADQSASRHLQALTSAVHACLREHTPEVVITHPYEGGHPDHDACAFAVHMACSRIPERRPVLVEAAFYHQGPAGIETGSFLPGASGNEQITCDLDPAERQQRSELLGCFLSQAETLRWFRRDLEVFRLAPAYDFTRPPHPGKLFYENFDWGMTAERFCGLVGRAELAGERAVMLCP